ncbi:MAG: alcohol dehydrogenase catalytic domain-containing protein [Clostridia bacterium]|nr:alcohol dehydrogenase catalytic domain-containing protein [Clostridia bacterium]
MKAKAAVFMGIHTPFEIREFDVTATPAGYGRSSFIACVVCGTDLHFYRGGLIANPPTVIGHEFVGKLEDCDPAEAAKYGLSIGDNVIADIAVPCGECLLCKSGDDANCVNMGVTNGGSIEEAPYLWGGYAEVNYTPLANLVKIPAGLDPTAVAVFACPGPTAMHAFRLGEQAGLDWKSINVAVVQGAGPVGSYAAMYMKAMGVGKVCVIAKNVSPEREALLKKLGADEVLDLATAGTEAVTKRLQAENGGLGVDLCYEASGAPNAVPQGMNILRNRGIYLVPGQYSNSGGIEIQPQVITFKAVRIIGSSQYSMIDVRDYLAFLVGHPTLAACIRDLATCYPVAETNKAFEDALAGKNVKTVLTK